jgi:hypothetical protein
MARWGVMGCGWGDTIVSLSNLYKNNCRNVIYLGKFKEIVPFLEAQDYIDNVRFVEFLPQTQGYWGTFFEMALRRNPNIMNEVIERFDFDRNDEYINCQLGFKGGEGILELVDSVEFSEQAIEESERIEKEYGLKDFIMFQPTSFHSTPPENFYPYWDDAFKKTLELYPDNQIVLIGERYSKLDVDHKKFIDLRGKFSTAESIGHLAKSAKLVVTLSNNLIYFCHMFDVPTINLCNKEFDCGIAFRRSMCKRNMINVDWRAPKEDAMDVLENWEEIIAKNSFYKILHHVDFISKFVNLDWSFVKESLEVDYFQEFLRLFYEYVDKDWYFTMNFPDLVALFSLHFNLGKGCTQASPGMNTRFFESYNYLSRKTTMLRKVGEVSDNFILFITGEDLLKQKKYLECNHIICVNNSSDGKLELFFKDNGFEFNNYKNLVYDARRIVL